MHSKSRNKLYHVIELLHNSNYRIIKIFYVELVDLFFKKLPDMVANKGWFFVKNFHTHEANIDSLTSSLKLIRIIIHNNVR